MRPARNPKIREGWPLGFREVVLKPQNLSRREYSKPCAVCLFVVGLGIRLVVRWTRLPKTTAKRLRDTIGLPKSKRPTKNWRPKR